MVTVDREQLLREMESVSAGLSSREVIEQSSCVVFRGGYAYTYNEEVACCQKTCLGIGGAVLADKLLALLRKLTDKTINVEIRKKDGGVHELRIKGKGRWSAGFPIDKKIKLPIDAIKKPKMWIRVAENFSDAVSFVGSCVGKDETQFHLTCIHLHPKWVEACDNFRAARFKLDTGLPKAIMVRKEALKYVTSFGMTEFGLTKSWIHFKNSNGLILSCRLFIEEYPPLDEILNVKGIKTSLPKGLVAATEKAALFTEVDGEESNVQLNLSAGKVTVSGRSVHGWFKRTHKIKYNKQPLCFTIAPITLIEIIEKYNECMICGDKLRAGMGTNFSYVSTLGVEVVEDSEEKNIE